MGILAGTLGGTVDSNAAECPAPGLATALESFPAGNLPDVPPAEPLWPLAAFLSAEAHRTRGENREAEKSYRALVEWATGEAADGWGGSSLVPFALWRLLGYALQSDPDAALLEHADALLSSRFFRALGLDGPGRAALLPSLPDLESSIAKRMLRLSLELPGQPRLGRDFNTYLNLTKDTALDAAGERAMETLYGDNVTERERLDLFRARRLLALREFDAARARLESAYASNDLQISTSAGLLLAKHSRFDRPLEVNIDTLSNVIDISAKPEQVADALLLRARYYGRAAKYEEFKADLNALLKRTRDTYYQAEALYRLANHERLADVDAGLEAFRRLRDLGDDHHRVDSAHYLPAMALLQRRTSNDLTNADALLTQLNQKRPSGPYFLHSLFWRGRIAEWQDRLDDARALFTKLLELDPFGYFGLRARMHLEQGGEAARMTLPGSALRAAIAAAYAVPKRAPALSAGPYHRRLDAALDPNCGLYRWALGAEAAFQQTWPGRRLQALSVEALDDTGLLPRLAVLLALRQDALAAADDDELKDASNALTIAENVGLRAGEWNLAMFLAEDSKVPQHVKTDRQKLRHYLAVAYPDILVQPIAEAAKQQALEAAFLYALIRNESRFLPTVISEAGAAGLIQMLPSTLEALGDGDSCGVPRLSNNQARLAYLTNPERAIPLGACWLRRELLDKVEDNLQYAIIAHNAGPGRLQKWRAEWQRAGIGDDLELTLELVAYGSTRTFARRVMRDYILVDAIGLFE